MRDAFDGSAVLTLLRLRGRGGEWGLGGWGLSPPEGRYPREVHVSVCDSLCFLGVLIPKLLFFFNKVRFIFSLKEALKRLYFLLIKEGKSSW